MPKGRKKKTTPEVTGETPHESVTNTATAVAEAPANTLPPAAEEPPFEPTGTYTPVAEEQSQGRGRFRSWVTDSQRGYSKLADDERQRIVLLFDQKPPADVLTALKGAGFHFQPDYQGLQSAWVRRNDHEGRLQVEAIEKLIRDLIPGPDSPER